MKYIITYISVCAILFLALQLNAQTLRTLTYYDENWKELAMDTTAWAYRREAVVEKEQFDISVTDSYRNGNKQMTGRFRQIEPEFKHGDFVWYYPTGKVMKKARYEENLQSGLEEEFNADGTPLYARTFNKGKLNGAARCFYPDGKSWVELFFSEDSLIPEKNRFWNAKGEEVPYEKYLKKTSKKAEDYMQRTLQNEFIAGSILPEPLNISEVKAGIRYPEVCREGNIQGKVFCKLTIDRYGRVKDYVIVRSPHEEMTKAVAPLLKKIYFFPARSADCIFETTATLPFDFRLK